MRHTSYIILAPLLLLLLALAPAHAQCPPGPEEGEADYHPLTAGTIFTYDYIYYRNETCYPGNIDERTGTLTITLGEATCEGGGRRVQAEADIQVTRIVGDYSYPPVLDTTYVDVSGAFEVVEVEGGIVYEGLRDLYNLRVAPGASDECPIPRYHPSLEGDEVSVHPCSTPHLQYVTMRRDAGPILFDKLVGSCSNDGIYGVRLTLTSMTVAAEPSLTQSRQRLSAYPNPVRDRLHVSLPEATTGGEIMLFDLLGRVVLRHSIAPGATEATLPVRDLTPGVYVLRATLEAGGATARRVVVTR